MAEDDIGYPVAFKAAGGGGGKGFRVALTADELAGRLRGRRPRGREVLHRRAASTSSATCEDPRHVEVQVLADTHGNVHPPRRARLLDPAPPPEADRGGARPPRRRPRCASGSARSPPTRRRAVGYRRRRHDRGPAGQDGEYFFLEMNTRVQVEHCVTEMVTGIDIVREQIRIAAGEPLSVSPGGRRAARPRDRVPDQRRGRRTRTSLPPRARSAPTASPPAPACASTPASSAGCEVTPTVRPDGRQADRLGRRSRARDAAHAARARRVRDRGPDDPDPLPPGDPRDRAVGQRRDLPRPDRGPGVAEVDRPPSRLPRRPSGDEGEPPRTSTRDYKVEVSGKLFDVKVIGAGVRGRRRTAPPRLAAASDRPSERAQGGRRRRPRRRLLDSPLQGNMFKVAVEKGAERRGGRT